MRVKSLTSGLCSFPNPLSLPVYRYLFGVCAAPGAFLLLRSYIDIHELHDRATGVGGGGHVYLQCPVSVGMCLLGVLSGVWVEALCDFFQHQDCRGVGVGQACSGRRQEESRAARPPPLASHPPTWQLTGQPIWLEGPTLGRERIRNCRNCVSLTHALDCEQILGSWTASQKTACGSPGLLREGTHHGLVSGAFLGPSSMTCKKAGITLSFN